jgi:hypothetical protein
MQHTHTHMCGWLVGLGVHRGSQSSGTYVIYMAIDYASGLGVCVLRTSVSC